MGVDKILEMNIEKIKAFRSALSKESDRGCSLFAAAYLDEALKNLFCKALLKDKKIEEDLFQGAAPLSSFSSRIKFAYYLGLLSKKERRDLDIIRKIRNEFAHDAKLISFESRAISDKCKSLDFSYHEKSHRARGHFTAAVFGILANIHITTYNCEPPEAKSDNAPTREDKDAHARRIAEILSKDKNEK